MLESGVGPKASLQGPPRSPGHWATQLENHPAHSSFTCVQSETQIGEATQPWCQQVCVRGTESRLLPACPMRPLPACSNHPRHRTQKPEATSKYVIPNSI